MSNVRAALAWRVSLLALVACRPSAQLQLEIDTDLAVPAQIDSVLIEVEGRAPATPIAPVALGGAIARPLRLQLVPGAGAGPVSVTVSARLGEATLLRRRVTTAFVAGEARLLPVFLSRRCLGVVCDDGQSCSESGCVPDGVEGASLPRWPACGVRRGDCEPDAEDRCETDLRSSTAHCGACGHACASGAACVEGVCDDERLVALAAGDVRASSSARGHSCAARADGAVVCWGANAFGQLGDGRTAASAPPVRVAALAGASRVAVGPEFSCALANGRVLCWGRNDLGQLGDGSTNASSTPRPVALSSPAVDLVAGECHACALLTSGEVACWGCNPEGQLGDGTRTTRSTAALVSGLRSVAALVAGSNHNCAYRSDPLAERGLWCWGQDGTSMLGDGNSVASAVPVRVRLDASWRVAALGGYHSCAQVPHRGATCWGADFSGQLGNGAGSAMLTLPDPRALLPGSAAYVGLVAGQASTCAWLESGGVACWGANVGGQLGVVNPGERTVPEAVPGLREVVRVAMGANHTCALREWGGVVCWGTNAAGQVTGRPSAALRLPSLVEGLP